MPAKPHHFSLCRSSRSECEPERLVLLSLLKFDPGSAEVVDLGLQRASVEGHTSEKVLCTCYPRATGALCKVRPLTRQNRMFSWPQLRARAEGSEARRWSSLYQPSSLGPYNTGIIRRIILRHPDWQQPAFRPV